MSNINWKNWQRELLLITGIIIYLAIYPNLTQATVDTFKCRDCHGNVTIIESSRITKSCLSCHNTHGKPLGCCEPTNRDPSAVHSIHGLTGAKLGAGILEGGGGQPRCRICHLSSPVSCTRCHNLHTEGQKEDSCKSCHGKLPTPKGHESFRDALKKSKHAWMNCETCHKNYNINRTLTKFNLKFKDQLNVSIQDNIKLCKVCHSYQYDQYIGTKEGIHPKSNKTCADCHNPHTTSFSGPIVEKENNKTSVAASVPEVSLSSIKTELITKFPILGNPLVIIIFLIVIIAAISEHFLSIHEKGKKVASNLVRVEVDEENLLTLEIKLSDRNTLDIYDMIEKFDVEIAGTTLSKKTDVVGPNIVSGREEETYMYVMFIDTQGLDIDQQNIIEKIKEMNNVIGIRITDKYEL